MRTSGRRRIAAAALAGLTALAAPACAADAGGGSSVRPSTTVLVAPSPMPTVAPSLATASPATSSTSTTSTTSTTGTSSTTSTAVAPATAPAPTTTAPSIDEPGSWWWLVDADRPLPPGYVPADLVTVAPVRPGGAPVRLTAPAAAALEAMFADASAAGYELLVNSAYRSADDQQRLWDRYVTAYGAATAATLVAPPGTSEHQTGMAVDVGLVGLPDDQSFGATTASDWVADNAHRFGFIVRYPPDKSAITGYADEPWHLRFVGRELAAELHDSGLTMEEWFGLVPAPVTPAPATTN